MHTELYYLTLVALFTGCQWAGYASYTALHDVQGNFTLLHGWAWGFRGETPKIPEWVRRAQRAHANSVENLVVFAALVLAAHGLGISTGVTQIAALAYFWLRVGHWLSCVFGILYVRTFLWAAAWLCQMAIALQILVK